MRARIVLSLAVTSLVACGPSSSGPETATAAAPISAATSSPGNAGGNKIFDVATWNLYVGADVGAVLGAPSADAIPALAAQAWATVQLTDFHERAAKMAELLAESKPVAIGLQEAALWRTQTPANAFLGGPPDAQDVAFDFIAILRAALAERGLDYDVAAIVENVDIELTVPVELEPLKLLDVRLTDRGAILVRRDVQWTNAIGENFDARMPVVIGDPAAPVLSFPYLRGWTSVDVKYRGEWFRFLNTQLEAFSEYFRTLQAREILDLVDASPLPVVAVGDYNALPDSDVHALLTSELMDVWTAVNDGEPGFTSGLDAPLLRAPPPPYDERIDYVLTRGPFMPLAARVVGDQADDRTESGMWPSDHAGVVARLRYVEPRFLAAPR
jgi:hypothetical protein